MNRYVITDYGVIPNTDALQTEAIQKVLDLCKNGGGTVVIPRGCFCIASLRMWSDTTLYLESGAQLLGSEECTNYEVFDVPAGVELRTDMELITQYYLDKPWPEYRRAMISAYGEKNIAIIGEGEDSFIDGRDCYDPDGEEGFRGPHGVFFTNCQNIVMKNYTIKRNGNFMHQVDNCRNILMENVTCLAGHDGIHLHHCTHTLIRNCRFITGDDCIAGINIKDLTVKNCEINTSCQAFRIGGHDILVEDCHIWGPGYYPHRRTVVQGKGVELPREEGRHNIHALVYHFASTNFPSEVPYGNYVFRNCLVETVDRLMLYQADGGPLESGAYLADMTFENVTFQGMLYPAHCIPSAKVPLTVTLKNCSVDFREESRDCGYGLFAEGTENLRVVVED
ncbi:MAG: right-handed parallel beta-helix repeat-containing protein [Clostridia bacterium]|nr:right-handed parallel beta-helix repeat-containing protein [Clostridia bacterium]